MKKYISVFSLLFFISCSTAYQKNGFSGGYSDYKVGKNRFNVEFRGNGYTSGSKVKRYWLRRCSEIALENNFSNFVVLDKDAQNDGSYISQTNYTTGFTTHNKISKHSYSGIIELTNNENVGFSAKEILNNSN